MRKLVLPLAAALIVAVAGTADAGTIYFTAYDGGKLASVKNTKTKRTTAGTQIAVVSQAAYDKMSAQRKKLYSAVEMCGTNYYITKRGLAWQHAHEEAHHEIKVRDHVRRGHYAVICPKEAAAAPKKTH
jgi:hypothetical protein